MNKLIFLHVLALVLAVVALVFAASDVLSQAGAPEANIELTPSSGFSSFTIVGTGFPGDYLVTIEWDGRPLELFPGQDIYEDFTVIADVPAGSRPGRHTVTAISEEPGYTASATFTVADMTGPQGPEGLAGADGASGAQGSPGPQGSAGPAGPEGNMGRPGEESGPVADMTAIIVALATIVLNLGLMARRAMK